MVSISCQQGCNRGSSCNSCLKGEEDTGALSVSGSSCLTVEDTFALLLGGSSALTLLGVFLLGGAFCGHGGLGANTGGAFLGGGGPVGCVIAGGNGDAVGVGVSGGGWYP